MYRFISFEEIDKNKWNGTVYYSSNGNPNGFFWYLKAIIGEWDAIVESDYETVMPVLKSPLKPDQYALLGELGPYSVNVLNANRVGSIFELLIKHNVSSRYPLNSQLPTNGLVSKYPLVSKHKAILQGGRDYEALSKSFSDELSESLNVTGYSDVTVTSSLKPEMIVELLNENAAYKNALMRIMYNAMHRGIGFSSGIQDKESGKILAVSFFINSHNCLYELVTYNLGNKRYRQLIFDLLLRNESNRMIRFESFHRINDLHEMGFDSEPVYDILLKNDALVNLKKAFGKAY